MPSKTLEVVLKANTRDYISQMDKAGDRTERWTRENARLLAKYTTDQSNVLNANARLIERTSDRVAGAAARSTQAIVNSLSEVYRQSAGANNAVATQTLSRTAALQQSLSRAARATVGYSRDMSRAIAGARGEAAGAVDDLVRLNLIVSGGLLVGLGFAIKKFADFDAIMSEVGAVSNASAKDLAALREEALQAGRTTIFTASEAAQAEAELAKAGVAVKDILGGGLTGALNLAAAGHIGVAEAAKVAASAMNVFSLRGEQMTHVADLLARGANASQGEIHDFALALNQSGDVARQFGLNLDDTVLALTLFAKYGNVGSDAGTSLKSMFIQLATPSKQAQQIMHDLGLEFYDAKGQFIGLEGVAEQLHTRLAGLSEQERNTALGVIFGSDAIRAANKLYREGAQGVQDLRTQMDGLPTAAELAAKKLDNLKGDVEQLRGALETGLIKTGEQSNGVLRFMVQRTTDLANAYSTLPSQAQGAVAFIGAVAAAGSASIAVFGTLAPKYTATMQALDGMGAAGQRTARALSTTTSLLAKSGPYIAAAAGLYALYASEKAKAAEVTESFVEALKAEQTGQIGATDAAIVKATADAGLLDTLQKLNISQRDFNDAVLGNEAAQRRVEDSILAANPKIATQKDLHEELTKALQGNDRAAKSFNAELNAHYGLDSTNRSIIETVNQYKNLENRFSSAQDKFKQLSQAENETALGGSDASTSIKNLSAAIGEASGQTQQLTDAQKALGQAFAAMASPKAAFQEATKDAQEAARKQAEAARDAANARISSGRDASKAERDSLKSHQKDELDALRAQKDNLASHSKTQTDAINDEVRSLQQRQRAELEAFDTTVRANKESAASIEDFTEDAVVHFDGYVTVLERQNEATRKWQDNLRRVFENSTRVTGRASDDIVAELAKLGPEAAPLVEEFANQSDEQTKRAAEAMRENMRLGSQSVADGFLDAMLKANQGMLLITEVGKANLRGNVAEIQKIAAQFGVDMANVADPILDALGLKRIGGYTRYEGSSLTSVPLQIVPKAEGGIENHVAQIAAGGPVRMWAEPETGGEAYIPLARSKENRSEDIWRKVGEMKGWSFGPFHTFASGGLYGLPTPPNFRSEGWMPGVGTGVTKKIYDSVVAAIGQGMGPGGSAPGVAGQWQTITSFLQGTGVPFTITSTTGGQHARGSYHYLGKAVDLVGPDMMGIFRSLLGAQAQLAELFYTPAGFSIKNSQRVSPPIAAAQHYDHVHAAVYDRGGALNPGWTMAYNGTGKTERVMRDEDLVSITTAVAQALGSRGVEKIEIREAVSARETAREVMRALA